MDQITFEFLTLLQFRRGFPDARSPFCEMPVRSRDGQLQLLEAEQDGKSYLFLVREDGSGRLWSRHFRAFLQGLPASIVAVHISADAKTRQQACERLQWHFIDVTAPEDDFPPDARSKGDGPGAPVPRRPIPPRLPASEKRRPDEAA